MWEFQRILYETKLLKNKHSLRYECCVVVQYSLLTRFGHTRKLQIASGSILTQQMPDYLSPETANLNSHHFGIWPIFFRINVEAPLVTCLVKRQVFHWPGKIQENTHLPPPPPLVRGWAQTQGAYSNRYFNLSESGYLFFTTSDSIRCFFV